ncbi:hypothetical protein T08_13759 [Trichinella sp. T8]|nr:hypothetical protein T08_13759 [Trichinella sp. T8]
MTQMERNAAVSAGQSSRCRLILKRPLIRRDIQRCKESRRIVDDLKGTVMCSLTFTRWGISPWKSCGLLRALGNHRARKRQPDKNTQETLTQLLNPCLRKIGERRLVTVNETCSDFI